MTRVTAADFIHPEDAAAQEQLRSLPLFGQFLRLTQITGMVRNAKPSCGSEMQATDPSCPNCGEKL